MAKGYSLYLVLGFVGLAPSTFYAYAGKKEPTKTADDQVKAKVGRPKTQFSYTLDGKKVADEQIKEWLCELVCQDGFPYGYKKLTAALVDDYGLVINHKKVYRLCKELDILKPQRICKPKQPRRLAQRIEVTGPNQLWEMLA